MPRKPSPKSQAIKDMIKAGLNVALVAKDSIIISNEQIHLLKNGRII